MRSFQEAFFLLANNTNYPKLKHLNAKRLNTNNRTFQGLFTMKLVVSRKLNTIKIIVVKSTQEERTVTLQQTYLINSEVIEYSLFMLCVHDSR